MDKLVSVVRDPRDLSIAERLRLVRTALGWTQVFLCQTTGINPNAWNNYERRGQRPSTDEVLKLTRIGVTPDYVLLGLTGNMRVDIADKIQRMLIVEIKAPKPIKPRRARARR
jgi:transcriptional regulator with XRE-family HTH domain